MISEKKETVISIYLLSICTLAIGTSIFSESEYYNTIWFCVNYISLLIPAVYFSTKTKSNLKRWALACVSGQIFTAMGFEVIFAFHPEMAKSVNKPSATFVWWVMALMATLVIILVKNADRRETH